MPLHVREQSLSASASLPYICLCNSRSGSGKGSPLVHPEDLVLHSRYFGSSGWDPYEWRTVHPEVLCIWMHCILCNIFTWNNLYDISQIHNSNLMGKRTDQRQVMADRKHADIFFLSEGVPEARSQTPAQKHPAQKSPHRKPGSPVPVKALLQY